MTSFELSAPSGETGSRTDRSLRVLSVGSVLAFLAATLLVLGVVLWSATRADQVARERLLQTVSFAVAQSALKIPYDQESVAIWDEAVLNTRNAFNPKWVNDNLGVWMYDYFKHDHVYVVDAKNRVSYAMTNGKQTDVGYGIADAEIELLATTLRKKISAGALDAFEAGKARIPRAEDFAILDGRPALISVMPLVPHSPAVAQERGSEVLIASVRFLDGSFLADLGTAHLLEGVRFSATDDVKLSEQSYTLRTEDGAFIGHLAWTPQLPGSTILADVLPFLAAGLVGIGIAIAFLIRDLKRTYTNLITSEAQATHLAFHDTLTGLPNRAYFRRRLDEELSAFRGEGQDLALMCLDLDRFKQVNDTLGHAAGDMLLCEVAARLRGALKAGDLLGRIGGDEFAILLNDLQNKEDIEALCRTIVSAMSQPFEIASNQASIGISIGIAMTPEAGVTRGELARKADIALYQAKKDALQHYKFFDENMNEAAQQRHALEAELRQSLETDTALEVVYQPVYHAGTLTVSSVEALVRWNHPRLGSVSPLVFVGLAEECGLIDQLGEWVLRQACATAQSWSVDVVSVNVSPLQFRQPDFAERVLGVLDETGLPPNRLEIEITESTLLDASDASGRSLKALRSAGVKIALDDFGTGYSSLSYLMKLEIDRIKIDRSFVRNLGDSSQSNSIVQAIVTMAHAVGVAVTAEGVETRAQQDFLSQIGCNNLQGYLLSPPLSALGLVEVFARNGEHLVAEPNNAAGARAA
ncbi:bifunctional diguanylate cyclase/phosphodiesterase [Hyphomicrobium sp.]|uniref:bifunctional diguanylate cyclase/phosphodiesterase n=1 Tax=Hyphomicrobium sp. TaxID=82 RepID=UPI002E33733F|nr:EAL domain-containing protein [Hyphomicrobium sp.]HEX2840027.1 EAL domain-containing protein [Hyphomicrobium sp.]